MKNNTYEKAFRKFLYEILSFYKYNFKNEILDAIDSLGKLDNPNQNKKVIKNLILSPVIDDISFDGKSKFKIYSTQFGEIPFELATYRFKNNDKIIDYMNKVTLKNNCHNNAYFLSKVLKNYYSITSICYLYFCGKYYHSYTYDKKRGEVIDLCHNLIMDKELYDFLQTSNEISIISNKNIEKACELIENNQPQSRCQLIKLALYKQYLLQKKEKNIITEEEVKKLGQFDKFAK